jgi:poly(3-hydroxybutyrate) depolymerase
MQSRTLLIPGLLLSAASAPVLAQSTVDGTFNLAGGGSMPYRVFLPESYTPTANLPVVLYLHSAAERGTSVNHIFSNNYGGFTWTNDWVGHLVNETQTGDHQAILVMPQSGLGNVWNSMTAGDNWGVGNYNNATQNAHPITKQLQGAVDIVGNVLNTYSTNENRVYVTGPSMGGFGTWDALARFPQMFAAAAPLAGGGNYQAAATTFANKPVWMMHGAVDGLIPASNTDQLYQAMQNGGGSPIYSRIPNEGHGGFDLFYTPNYYTTVTPSANTGLGADLYEWMFAQSLENQGPVIPPPPQAAPIVLNFGAGAQSNNNSFAYTADGTKLIAYNHMEAGSVINMKDTNGNETGISVSRDRQIGPGGGINTASSEIAGIFPTASMQTSLYTYGGLVGQGSYLTLTFTGMIDGHTYTFDILGAVATAQNITQFTQYTIAGLTTQVGQVNVINNDDMLVTFEGIQSVNGTVVLTVTGLNGSLGYINGMQITDTTLVPEPTAMLLLGTSFAALARRRRRVAA